MYRTILLFFLAFPFLLAGTSNILVNNELLAAKSAILYVPPTENTSSDPLKNCSSTNDCFPCTSVYTCIESPLLIWNTLDHPYTLSAIPFINHYHIDFYRIVWQPPDWLFLYQQSKTLSLLLNQNKKY